MYHSCIKQESRKESQPSEQEPESRPLTGKEAWDVTSRFRGDDHIPLPSGVLGVGAQRLGESENWGITVFTTDPDVDTTDFIREHLPGLQVFVEQPLTGEPYIG